MDTLLLLLGAFACAVIVFLLVRRQRPATASDIVVGGIYASQREDGAYGVVKVLAVDKDTVHVRMYRNTYDTLPESLDPADLQVGEPGDPEGFGIDHAPFAIEGWLDKETLVARDSVRDEELDGYHYYRKAIREGK